MDNNNNHIINELQEISPLLAGIPRYNVFSLPADYFNFLPVETVSRIHKEEAGTGVPESYFNNLSGEIMSKIRLEEAQSEEHSPILSSIGKQNVQHLPDGYFDSLADNIVRAAKPKTRVVSISFFTRYAAAAVITGILGLGLFSRFNNRQDDADMTPILANAETIIRSGSFEAELNSLEEKDITEYLETQGHDVEAALLVSAAENNELPDAMDYVLQENTLDRFMDNHNIAGEF